MFDSNFIYNINRALLAGVLSMLTAAGSYGQSATPAAAQPSLAGNWVGSLQVGPTPLRLVVKISKDDSGKLAGKMDSVDQGANNMPIDAITFENGALRFTMKQIAGEFEGKLSADGKKLEGTWKQGPVSLPLTLVRTDEVPALKRPQTPQKPYPYDEREVTYENAPGRVKLAGTLTVPRGDGPFPAVLLISGSGPQDRDEALLGHRPFLVLADHLTRQGIAVLRVDDRGVGGSSGDWMSATMEDVAGDVLAGVAFLKQQAKIDPKKIGLVGHSEGAIVAPIAAVRSPDVAFVVLMAGTGVTGEEIIHAQTKLVFKAMDLPERTLERESSLQRKLFDIVKQRPGEGLAQELRKTLDAHFASLSESERNELEPFRSVYDAQMKMVESPWFRFFLMHDPRPTLRQVKCPVLAVIGEHDLQVPAEENLREIEKALVAGGNRDHTVKKLLGLNHLFQTSATGSLAEYGTIEETFAPAALKTISEWIVERMQ